MIKVFKGENQGNLHTLLTAPSYCCFLLYFLPFILFRFLLILSPSLTTPLLFAFPSCWLLSSSYFLLSSSWSYTPRFLFHKSPFGSQSSSSTSFTFSFPITLLLLHLLLLILCLLFSRSFASIPKFIKLHSSSFL